jgi:competence protein ComEA
MDTDMIAIICLGGFMKNKYFLVIILVISSLIGIVIYEKREKQEENYLITNEDSETGETEENGQGSNQDNNSDLEAATTDNSSDSEAASGTVSTYVCGEVYEPGVYELTEGSRVADAIDMAGGMLDTAAKNYLNLADIVADGSKIYVPSEEEVSDVSLITPESQLYSGTGSGTSSDSSDGEKASNSLVNINTASLDELKTLPGIGDAKAQAIIDYRTQNGSFSSIDEITNVSGIGDSTYSNIKDKITT